MRNKVIPVALALLLAACGADESADGMSSHESAVAVASEPFSIGDVVGNEMGDHVGEMGADVDGDPMLNAMAEVPEDAPEPDASSPVAAGQGTEGGPEI